jgi:predicted XRE-type DNA-binding protein
MNIQHIGSNFNDFLVEEDLLENVTALALKRVIVWQIEQEMALQKITKAMMAKMMNVTDSDINELLDVNNTSLGLATLVSAATVLGKSIRVEWAEESSEI